ncbi:MAG: BMP family ABC transporter substrate-binding protein [Ruminiclostridium sp.]|nr:BMP family ABC transporter substrate-binding protein [Ruminiclostridium sp.]
MGLEEAGRHYQEARKLALKDYSRSISKGQTGYLPFIENVLKNIEIISEIDLGVVDIPLEKIAGTYTYARSLSFAGNFMPLLAHNTEFGQKWQNLCNAHINEGIRDPIKAYEYMNWFYVVEGNKRVSVLKFFNAFSIPGSVTRLVPKWDESDINIVIYYEFLEFYRKTGINLIWFTRRNSFNRLLEYIESLEINTGLFSNRYKYFTNSIYLPFRKIFRELGGQKIPITSGDAFLEYTKIYGMPLEINEELLKSRLGLFIPELEQLAGEKTVDIQTMPQSSGENILSAITTLVRPKKVMKIAFVYAKDIQRSSWTYSHEMGRNHVDRVLKEYITTTYVDNVPESLEAYEHLKRLAMDGNDVIFATSPSFINATLKAALEFPGVKFLNCSETHSYKRVNTYFGRIYEPRFLAGIAAGSVTKSNILGYVGTQPVPGVINGINSFALGARMVNPDARVVVEWANQWDSLEMLEAASIALINKGADIISHHDTLSNREFSREYGVYSVISNIDEKKCGPDDYIAAPVWNWGIFYEKILVNILNNALKKGASRKVVNFWWGLESGIVDFFYSKRLVPRETQKLIEFLKSMIINGMFHPFTGPIYNQNRTVKVKENQIATRQQIVTMNWFVDAIESELPKAAKKVPASDILQGMVE